MAQAGIIKILTGSVNARTPDGQIRQLMAGDMVYENEIIETAAGAELTIELNDGRTLVLAENSQLAIDATVIAAVGPQDAVVTEAEELQAALEEGEEIPDEEPAAGEEDKEHDYDLAYYAGDQSGGEVSSYLFDTEYGGEEEDIPDIEGEEEEEPEPEPGPEPEPEAEFEPEPEFIVGSDPQDDGRHEDEVPDSTPSDDTEGTSETDYHTVNSNGDVQGAILGQEDADILVGDPGSVTPVSNNYILVLDYSHSVTDNFSLENLFNATKSAIQALYNRVQQAADGYEIKINLLPFAGEADYDNHSAWISFTNQNGIVALEGAINSTAGRYPIDTIQEAIDWIDDSTTSLELGNIGLTNYNSAFTEAQDFVNPNYDQNSVIFISDGSPNTGGNYSGAHSTLEGMVDSIRAVGIDMSPLPTYIMGRIDSTGTAASIESDQLSDVMIDLIPQDVYLDPTGTDAIHGSDGDDLIFGDVLNTDGVFTDIAADHDLSGITEPANGSGWQVFETLENELSTWTRADTIQYIQENHEDLAEETVLGTETEDGNVRDGGGDYIEGGAGNDIIYGQEGDDTIDTGSGDDVVDGGSGFDTLVVTSETELDFSNVSNIEKIDLNEDGLDQTMTLSLYQVLSMTDENNTLQITGETGDSVTLTGVADGEWTHDGNGLFTNVADNGIQVTIASVNEGVDIDVDVDNGDSFQV